MQDMVSQSAERKVTQSARMRSALLATLNDVDAGQFGRAAGDAASALVATFIEFEAITRDERERLLQNSNAAAVEDIELYEWYASRYDQLARMARAITERPTTPQLADEAASAWAYAILLRGNATKWRQIAGHRTIAPRGLLHQVFRSAVALGIGDRIQPMIVEGQPIETTVESLYARTLLLERFASGNLTPQRLEILDNWLISWMGAMWMSRDVSTVRDGPALCVDTSSETHGLVRLTVPLSADYFMAIRPLERQLARAVQSFHRGVIYPGWGIGMAFRIDEHVAVIEFLEHEFRLLRSATQTKSKRAALARAAEAEVFLGLDAVHAACGRTFTNTRRLRLLDISLTGMGLLAGAEEALALHVGDLVAVRLEGSATLLLGEIVRKATGAERNTVIIGVQLLSKAPLAATASMTTPHAGAVSFGVIFFTGDADNGNNDALIMSDATYRFDAPLSVQLGKIGFDLRPGRVRKHGRGWKLVGFDVDATR